MRSTAFPALLALFAIATSTYGQATRLTITTVGALPGTCFPGTSYMVTDGTTALDCATGSGSIQHLCICDSAGTGYDANVSHLLDDSLWVGSSSNAPTSETLPDTDADGLALGWDQTTNAFTTQTNVGAAVVSSEITDGEVDALDLNTDARADTCFQVLFPGIADTDEWEIELPGWPGTMLDFRCEAQGGTSFTVDVCDGEDLGDDTCSTSILGSTLVCDTSGANDNTLSATGFVASDSVSIVVTAVSGTVDWARMVLNCQRD